MKKTFFTLSFLFVLVMTGCTRTVYVYPEVEYPTITKPLEVEKMNSYIYKKCLFIDDSNTSLCNSHLNKVITQVVKLRENEKTCSEIIDVYDNFIQTQKQQSQKESEFSFGF